MPQIEHAVEDLQRNRKKRRVRRSREEREREIRQSQQSISVGEIGRLQDAFQDPLVSGIRTFNCIICGNFAPDGLLVPSPRRLISRFHVAELAARSLAVIKSLPSSIKRLADPAGLLLSQEEPGKAPRKFWKSNFPTIRALHCASRLLPTGTGRELARSSVYDPEPPCFTRCRAIANAASEHGSKAWRTKNQVFAQLSSNWLNWTKLKTNCKYCLHSNSLSKWNISSM